MRILANFHGFPGIQLGNRWSLLSVCLRVPQFVVPDALARPNLRLLKVLVALLETDLFMSVSVCPEMHRVISA